MAKLAEAVKQVSLPKCFPGPHHFLLALFFSSSAEKMFAVSVARNLRIGSRLSRVFSTTGGPFEAREKAEERRWVNVRDKELLENLARKEGELKKSAEKSAIALDTGVLDEVVAKYKITSDDRHRLVTWAEQQHFTVY